VRGLTRLAGQLTPRGRAVAVCGLAVGVVGLAAGDTDLLRLAVALVAAPLVALASLRRARLRLGASRSLSTARVPVGDSTRVSLTVTNSGRLGSGELFFADHLPHALGSFPRFTIDGLAAHSERTVAYNLNCPARGRYRLGPLELRVSDPFGLARLNRTFPETAELLVVPAVEKLPPVGLHGEWAGGGEQRPRQVAARGEDDVTTRPYRPGDDLRRVHWRTTARLGALTVRREEQPWQARGVLVLDTRTRAHLGQGPDASFEYAVRAVASIGAQLAETGLGVRMITDTGEELHAAGGGLDALAEVRMSRQRSLAGALAALRTGGEGVAVAVLGRLSPEDVDALARARHRVAWGVAVLLEVEDWHAPRVPAQSTEVAERVLSDAGWRVLRAGRDSKFPMVWAGAGRTTAAGRAGGPG
jgi:uncharacterized protein (DUF58 family)